MGSQKVKVRMQKCRRDVLGFTPLLVVLVLALLMLARRAECQTIAAPADTKAAAKKAARPTTAIDQKSCVTAECHVKVKDYKVVHGPVNVNACDACHKLTDASKHTFALTRDKTQICTFCHQKIETGNNKFVHKPVTTGDCLPCHDPHGGKTARFIRGGSMRETCSQCHKDVIGKKKKVHGPVAAGACEACHAPHAAKFPKLLNTEGKELCLSCHKEMGDQMKSVKVLHKPVKEGECAQCHDPHASDHPAQIKAGGLELCVTCHEPVKKAAMDAKYKHSIVTKDYACMNCHTAHGGQLGKLLKNEPIKICMNCHTTAQKTADGREIKSVADVKDPKLVKHGPLKDGLCTGCHDVHGSNVSRLLTKAYPETFYAKFDEKNFALCVTCHDKKLVEAKEAEGLTNFRNGKDNLHFVHVSKDRGRTCRACHETHTGKNPVRIRESVPYGQWELPIGYKKTETGGSCAPGCHKEYAYDRKTPVTDKKESK